ncbi:MAG: hypothetical protein IIA65_03520 [Planctomycetes bacterium]|nr:hypothetical protein [Planctomycetota bacterium]
MVPAEGFLLLSARQWGDAFGLSRNGDQVYLNAALGETLLGYGTEVRFGASAEGRTMGRYRDPGKREADFVALAEATPGAVNGATGRVELLSVRSCTIRTGRTRVPMSPSVRVH